MNQDNAMKSPKTRTFSMTSNRPDAKEHKITLPESACWVLLLVCCVVVGIVLGVMIFDGMTINKINDDKTKQHQEYLDLQDEHAELKYQYDQLQLLNENLTDQVQVLSDTINKRTLEDEAAEQSKIQAHIPSGFPVTGSVTEVAAPKEDTDTEGAAYFESAENSIVVAVAEGTVSMVRQNAYGNYEVRIDHGNGYVTSFTNAGYPLVEEGTNVLKGTPLFLIQTENTLTKYRVYMEDTIIDVYDVLRIAG